MIIDMQTQAILLQGPSEEELYPIYLKKFQANKSKSRIALLSRFTALLGVTAPLQTWNACLASIRIYHLQVNQVIFNSPFRSCKFDGYVSPVKCLKS